LQICYNAITALNQNRLLQRKHGRAVDFVPLTYSYGQWLGWATRQLSGESFWVLLVLRDVLQALLTLNYQQCRNAEWKVCEWEEGGV